MKLCRRVQGFKGSRVQILIFWTFVAVWNLSTNQVTAQQDSMAYFRALLEHTKPSAMDIGGMVAPEILAVHHYPFYPQPGQKVTVRAKIQSYSSMVSYKITRVELTCWKQGAQKQKLEMKAEDTAQGIYSAVLPEAKDGDEILYAVRAEDDWGNTAVEVAPEEPLQIVMKDDEDSFLAPALDVQNIQAACLSGRLHLCVEFKDKPQKSIGKEIAVYGLAVFDRDVRYQPYYTEGELTAGWIAAYFPQLKIQDLIRMNDMLGALTGGKKKEKRAEFAEDGNKLCFSFPPETIRRDPYMGLKVLGISATASLIPMTFKPADATHAAMIYPAVHSFKVYKWK